jgi:hypothetical protein
MNTIIKISGKMLHNRQTELMQALYNILQDNFDIELYRACYDGQFEQGFRITCFNTISKDKLESIHNMLGEKIADYGCFYLKNAVFSGCIKEYLYNKSCGVAGVWEKAYA